MLKSKLQIYLVSYNRKKKLQETLNTILADSSPVKNFDITILDNASTDGSSELIKEYCAKYKNLKHTRHSVNIGGTANISRAFELGASCGKEYFWILCDDDKYDFSNWVEVEDVINKGEDVICVADYAFDKDKDKSSAAHQIFQLTFVPAGIYKSELIGNDVLINMYDGLHTILQQVCVAMKCVNSKKNIYVLKKPIVFNGCFFEDKVDDESLSYTRGADDNWILSRKRNTSWVLGFSGVITLLKDANLRKKCLEVSIPSKYIYGSWEYFYKQTYRNYFSFANLNYFYELFVALPAKRRLGLASYFFVYIIKQFFGLFKSKRKA